VLQKGGGPEQRKQVTILISAESIEKPLVLGIRERGGSTLDGEAARDAYRTREALRYYRKRKTDGERALLS